MCSLHDVAGEVAEHAPVDHRLDRHAHVHAVRAAARLVPVQPPVWDLAGEHGRARALAPFGIGTRAEHGIGVDDGRRLHPREVLAESGHVAGQIRRARLEDLDAFTDGKRLARLVAAHHLLAGAQRLPVQRVRAALQVARVHDGLRRLYELVGVEVEERKDGVAPQAALVLEVVLQERVGRARHAGHVLRVEKALGTERLGVAHQQVHRLLRGLATAAIEHGLLVVGEREHQRAASASVACRSSRSVRAAHA
jgi:hypothetical protein